MNTYRPLLAFRAENPEEATRMLVAWMDRFSHGEDVMRLEWEIVTDPDDVPEPYGHCEHGGHDEFHPLSEMRLGTGRF